MQACACNCVPILEVHVRGSAEMWFAKSRFHYKAGFFWGFPGVQPQLGLGGARSGGCADGEAGEHHPFRIRVYRFPVVGMDRAARSVPLGVRIDHAGILCTTAVQQVFWKL